MFYAIPEITTRSWESVNAIFWVAKFLKWLAEDNPNASLVIATDVWQSFRANLYTEYKAQRERMPDNLRSQIDGVFSLFEKSWIPVLAYPGYEADDIIGSIAHEHEADEYQIVIISSDKDLCQFVRDGHVHIYDAMKRKFMKEKDVIEKFWVPALKVRDYLAIVGDSSDNIPGINGFGPKKAVDLLTRYGTLEWIYENMSDLTQKMQEVLVLQKENAFLSQTLATIHTDLDIRSDFSLPFSPWLENPEYIDLLKHYEFRSLLPKVSGNKKDFESQAKAIKTEKDLRTLFADISKDDEIYVDIENNFVFFSIRGLVYNFDTRNISVNVFLSFFHTAEATLVGYDIKNILHGFLQKEKSLEWDEGQGRLF